VRESERGRERMEKGRWKKERDRERTKTLLDLP
jgi:hypothetical protein